MKTLILALLTTLPLLAGDEYRTWTNLSGKTISAKIIDKKPDHSEARLTVQNGKSPWVKAVDLIEADREFIKAWKKKPMGFDHLEVNMIGNPGKRLKQIRAVARAWNKPLTLTVIKNHPRRLSPVTREIAAHGSTTVECETGNNYRVILRDKDGNVISEQTSTSKE